jgi:hypothetical protein
MTLERRCRLLARAYPDRERAEEVLTTLLDSNEGRRSPRVADAFDVLRHGLAARLGSTPAGTRYGRVGDAASVAVVLALLVQAATAVAIAANAFRRPPKDPWDWPDQIYTGVYYVTGHQVAAALIAAAVASAACAAAMAGRVALARLLVLAAAAGGAATFLVERSLGERPSFTSGQGRLVVALGIGTVLAVLLTGAVARAARMVPRWWWALAAGAALAVALYVVRYHPHELLWGRTGVALTAYAAVATVLGTLAVPLALTALVAAVVRRPEVAD